MSDPLSATHLLSTVEVMVAGQRRLSRDSVEIWAAAAETLPPTADHTELARWVQLASAPRDDSQGD